ncbi:MAG: dihydrofolate reductase family protein [Bacteroidota bacterium]
MTRKIKLYIATSLDGKIADSDGGVAWLDELSHPKGEDYGYADFYASIDTTLMGYNTYAKIEGFEVSFPYPDKKNYVFTRQKDRPKSEQVEFISNDILDFVRTLKQQAGQDIWLVGGGEINRLLIDQNLLDEIHIFIMPIILGDGISLLASGVNRTKLRLKQEKTYENGVLSLIYEVI